MKLQKHIEISTGHRLPNHKGGCYNFHGHNYQVLVEIDFINDSYIEDEGFYIDFGEIKTIVNDIDHRFLMYKDDPFLDQVKDLPGIYIVDFIPTAENMSLFLQKKIELFLSGTDAEIVSVKIDMNETSNSKIIR